jgi:hypothetical protein
MADIRVYRYVMNSASATFKVVIIILETYSVKKLYFLILSLVRSTEKKFISFITKMYASYVTVCCKNIGRILEHRKLAVEKVHFSDCLISEHTVA